MRLGHHGGVELEFTGVVIEWRGPAPYLFVPLPADLAGELADRPELSYGWGCIPVRARIGATGFTTSLMPRQGGYLLPVKVAVRRAEQIGEGATVTATIEVSAVV